MHYVGNLRTNQIALLLGLILSGMAGCSGGGLESTVSGTVTLDGQLIGPGTVLFVPANGTTNPSVGTIEPNGSYTVKSSRTEGLPAGRYRVSVTVFEPLVGAQPGERSTKPSKLIHPEKYTLVDSSGLEFDVASGSNEINIELKSQE